MDEGSRKNFNFLTNRQTKLLFLLPSRFVVSQTLFSEVEELPKSLSLNPYSDLASFVLENTFHTTISLLVCVPTKRLAEERSSTSDSVSLRFN